MLSYRKDIDGLRAIAILGVLFYHAFPKSLPGGFGGVDLFFVISGFLISSQIVKALEKNQFQFWGFYRRRVLRLFPSLIAVLFFSAWAGYFLLKSQELNSFGEHLIAAVGFVSNLLLFQEVSYFDRNIALKPLGHLWSLAIEEQFYLLWPLLLVLLWKVKKGLPWILILIFFISLGAAAMQLGRDPRYFYLLPFRMWEFMAGFFLAFYPLAGGGWIKGWIEELVAVCSMTGILVSYFLFEPLVQGFSIFFLILPVLSTVGMILSSRSVLNRKILSRSVVVWVGLISYPLYLVHGVVFSFAKSLGYLSEATWPTVFVLVLLSFFIAGIIYYAIEKPVRKKNKKAWFLLVDLLIFGAVGLFIKSTNGLEFRYVATENDQYRRNLSLDIFVSPQPCNEVFLLFPFSLCYKRENPTTAVIGDSQALHLVEGFRLHKNNEFNRVFIFSYPGCAAHFGEGMLDNCNSSITEHISRIKDYEPTISRVVFAGSWFSLSRHPLGREKALQGIRRMIQALLLQKIEVVMIKHPPTFYFSVEECVETPLVWREKLRRHTPFCQQVADHHIEKSENYDQLWLSLEKEWSEKPGIILFDAAKLFCPGGQCLLRRENRFLYLDESHLSIYGAKWVVETLIEQHYK